MLVRTLHQAAILAVSVLVIGMVACTAGPQVTLSEGAASRLRSIALLDIPEPTVELILNRGNSNESHSSTYAQLLADAQLVFSPLLAEAITRQLERSNYRVVDLPTQRPVLGSDGQIDLSAVDTNADAVLVVRFKGAGYASSSTTALQPWAIVEAQLFDTRTHQRLYARTFNAGRDLDIDGAMHLATDARFQFDAPAQLEAKLEDSANGIKDAELAIASAIGQDFAIGTRPVAGYTQAPPVSVPQTTAAERDREAAALMAAQWAAAEPTPEATPEPKSAPEVMPEAAPAASNQYTQSAAADAAPPAVHAAAPEANMGPTETLPAIDDTAALDAVEPLPAAAPSAAITPAPAATTDAADASFAVTSTEATARLPPPPSESAPAPAPLDHQQTATNVATPTATPPQTSVAESTPARAAARPGAAHVLNQRTPVRVSPTARAKVFAILPAGTAVHRRPRLIHNASGSWCYIDAGEISGWVPLETTQP